MAEKCSVLSLLLIIFVSLCNSQKVQVIYEGQNIAFYCNATGISGLVPVHYQWEFDNRVLIASDDHFSIRNIQKSDEGEYKCTATQFINNEPVVAVESTFISVRKADSIVTQDVEEGFLVRILCNVTGSDRPDGSGPLRYEWRNPNGTLVGTQWKLELGQIEMHESGVYVCRVSYEYNQKQMSTSSATRINVLKRAGIIFPGLSGYLLEVLETGDILQECKVISSKQSEYTYRWFGSDNSPVSNTAYLQRDYIVRPKDEGIYTCVATPTESGRRTVENRLVVSIIPLRFQISTMSEDLKIGGFTRKRISLLPPSNPRLTTRETFSYQWFTPNGSLISQEHGPEMHVKLQSPLDFGRYYVQVHGLNSDYNRYLTSYVTLDDGIVAPTYTVVIQEVSGPLYFNSRMELECATNPPNAQARVNWLGPDGQVVSDSSRLVFDKFLYQHQGRYTCQILLPNQVVLRQSVELTASGSVTENPGNGGRYTIAIIQSPLLFRYNDAVRLNCVVSPDPPFVQFEWVKDDQIIGRQSELFIPNFTPYDVGRYVCKARIEGVTDVSSNVTVSPRPIVPGSVDLVMRPDVIYQPVFTPFQIECISERPGVSPGAELSNGAPIETDNRFQLIRPDPQRLIISAPFGLSNVYNGYRIRCILPDTGAKEAILYMIDSCRFNESLCRTHECILTQNLCNGQPDCKDSSDEGDDFCNAGLTFSPTKVIVRPMEAFTLQCKAQRLGYRPQARLVNTRVNVENDPRFIVERPTQDVLIIRAPRGLSLNENNTQIECYFPERGSRIAIINVEEGGCQPGWFACRDRTCIPRTRVCDGVPTCPDGSDEQQCIEYCRPPNIACSSGECITPAMRCDGRRDCRDGFDEEGCPSRCPPPKFACRSGECIAPGLRCDGRPDCADRSDEWDCTEMRECLPPNFQCPSGECLPQSRRCDGRKDCLDGFDEQRCPSDCRPPNIPCPSGECLLSQQICDGRADCADGWDERSCAERRDCLPPNFQCPSGECLPQSKRCDGRSDCLDGFDEQRCPSDCRPPNVLCPSGQCLDPRQVCDGRVDCADGWDERSCATPQPLPPQRQYLRPYSSFRLECRSSQPNVAPTITLDNGTAVEQLPRFQVSRPSVDLVVAFIPDLTERDSGLRLSCSVPMAAARVTELIIQSSCPSSEWMCRDGQCVASHRFCDGRADCRDGSDEREPHCALTRCLVGQFTCGSGECIEQSLRCDGRHNCYDGSDERDCVVGPTVIPQRQTVYPYGSVQVECRSDRPGIEPSLTVDNGTSVDRLPRFQVTRPSLGVIVVRLTNLTERDRGLRLRCYYPTGESTTAEIIIESPCESHERMCRDGTCVREEYFCNGREDCRDGSDERPPHCEAPRCGPEQFGCLSGECIRSSLRCNGREDCYDGSDEIGCAPPRCRPDQFTCSSGDCISLTMRCDGRHDCSDGSDERNCGLVPIIRPGKPVIRPYEIYELECNSNQMGVRPDLRLLNGTSVENLPTFTVNRPRLETVIARTSSLTEHDSHLVIQCFLPSGNYSQIEIIVQSPCRPSELMCRDGSCLDRRYFCNGQQDCSDGSDERPPHCTIQGPTIKTDRPTVQPYGSVEIRCESHQFGIRPELRVANGTSVEDLKRFVVNRPSLQLIIARLTDVTEADRGLLLRCLYRTGEFVEVEIHIESPCAPGEYMCRDGRCIPQTRFCDGRRDCADGSDESPPRCYARCQPGQFACGSGECVDARLRCNGRPDCNDRSDEMDCVIGPTIRPERPVVHPYESLDIECFSGRTGTRPELRVSNGTLLGQLDRFHVFRPSLERVVARLDTVTEQDSNMVIICFYPTGESAEARVVVDSPCGPADMMCRDGTCLSRDHFCNGHVDCADGSDEQPPHCYTRCAVSDYRCGTGECIPPNKRCNGRRDCADGSDEIGCGLPFDVEVLPGLVRTRPYQPFKIECISHTSQLRPIAQFSDGRPVRDDPRFNVINISPTHIEISSPYGLTERDDDLIIMCLFPGVGNRTAVVDVQRPCPPGEFQCMDGRCLSSKLFCNGRPDCADGSDESDRFCHVDIRVRPGIVIVKPSQFFEFECISNVKGSAPQVLLNNRSIERDPRFQISRPTTEQVIVRAPQGLPDRGGYVFQCLSVRGTHRQVVVRLDTTCPRGQYRCPGGGCIPATAFCDGRFDCPDRSDEDNKYCDIELLIIPGYIFVEPNAPLEFVCESKEPGVQPMVRFVDGREVQSDPRFTIFRPSPQRIVVQSEVGLTELDDNTRIVCYTATGSHQELLIQVDTGCPPDHQRCRDGTCRPRSDFCNGRRDCPDGSDEDPTRCGSFEVSVTPGTINVRPHRRFVFECTSPRPGVQPQVNFDGLPVERNPLFVVHRPSAERVVVRAEQGLPSTGIHIFSCSIMNQPGKEVLVTVDDECQPGQFRCHDGLCIPSQAACDGRNDCPDGSDESPSYCPEPPKPPSRLHFSPREIRTQPDRSVRLECRLDRVESVPLIVRFTDGRQLSTDRRFHVSHLAPNHVVVEAPQGFDTLTRQIDLECVSSSGQRETATIYVDQSCQPGQRRCPGGDCIYVGQFCDGRRDCSDGYDERPESCALCDPISKPCESVNGRAPTATHFQIHWQCDGENDCGNGFDELNCRNDTRHLDPQCGSTHFQCGSGSRQYIPFSYWCDGTADCANGEDEHDCSRPSVIDSGRIEPYRIKPGGTLVLECESLGVPPPMIIWRFNWGCLPNESRARAEVLPSSRGCRGSRNRLTITNFRAGDDGIYNCEALISTHRAMSQDFMVLID